MNRFSLNISLICILLFSGCAGEFEPELTGFSEDHKVDQLELKNWLLSLHSPEIYRNHLYNLTTDPSFAGIPENDLVIDYIYSVMDSASLDVQTYDCDVLLPQPGENSIRLITPVVIDLATKEAV